VVAAISFSLVMWLSVVPMVLGLAVSLRLVEPRAHQRTDTNLYAHLKIALRQFATNARLRTLGLANVLTFALGESAWLFRSTFVATLWPVWAIGLSQLIGNATAAASYYYAGRIIRRFGEFRLLVGGMALSEAVNL